MDKSRLGIGSVALIGALVLLALCSPRANAALMTFDLVCVMNQANALCGNQVSSFGTVTLDDSVGVGQIGVSVNLAGTGEQFRDLMLNFSGAGVTTISSTDGQVLLSPNGFSIEPYAGLFDVGGGGVQGWAGNDLYSTTLTGNVALSLAMFDVLDSLGNAYVGIHIQNIGDGSGGNCAGNADGTTNCVPGSTGIGSLKIAGLQELPPPPDIDPIPEPMTFALMGAGLVALGLLRRRRKSDLS